MTFKKETSEQRLIYIGPNLPEGRISKYTVCIGGLPAHLKDCFAKWPELKSFFVTIGQMAAKEKERDTKGTPLYKYNQRIMEEMRNGL